LAFLGVILTESQEEVAEDHGSVWRILLDSMGYLSYRGVMIQS
jgi:hypothetical protein